MGTIIIINICAVFLGGMLGGTVGKKIPHRITESLTIICGFVSMAIGVVLTMKVNTLAVVTISLVIGTLIGELLRLEDRIRNGFTALNKKLLKSSAPDDDYMRLFIALLILSCTSGTGIFGSLNLGMTGDASVLLTKAVLDFVTVFIFAAELGRFAAVIAVPQGIVFYLLFLLAKVILPILSPTMIADFSAVGGVVSLITAFRIIKVKDMRISNTLPALILVFPISYLWDFIPF